MPTKATGSHPVSALIALVAGSVLSKYVWEVLPPLGTASQTALNLVDSSLVSVPTSSRAAGALVIFLAVSVTWEFAHYLRER
jgi:hypothetical protein